LRRINSPPLIGPEFDEFLGAQGITAIVLLNHKVRQRANLGGTKNSHAQRRRRGDVTADDQLCRPSVGAFEDRWKSPDRF
jgi:hypothetical protein